MTAVVDRVTRPVFLTRDGDTFRLAFAFNRALVETVKALPYASFQSGSKTWLVPVTDLAVQHLRRMFYDGLTDVPVDQLLGEGEVLPACRAATLRSGTVRRPFVVSLAMRGDNAYEKFSAIPGATWEKKAHAITFPPLAAVALAEMAARGVLDDPERLLSPAETVVAFDTRCGQFAVRGPDQRAATAFTKAFPRVDVVAGWRERGLDVAFADPFSEEVYRGELARVAPLPTMPALKIPLLDYQRRNVAVALQRTGFAIMDEPGLGKTAQAIAVGAQLLAEEKVTRVCVLVPGAVRTQWANEIERFTGESAQSVVVVRGDKPHRAAAYAAAAEARWFVVHYDVLARDLKALTPLFAGALVVADEGHRLKSYRSARTEAALKLCRTAARRLALSGTPLETSVTEWYQVLSGFAVPGFLGDPRDFNDRYRYPTKFGHEGARNLRELRARSLPHFARHTKAEVAQHLPPLRVESLLLDANPEYAAAVRRAHREAAAEIAKFTAANRGSATNKVTGGLFGDDEDGPDGSEMNAVGQLRMLCSSPRLVLASTSAAAEALTGAGLIPDEDGPKLDELRVMAADFRALSDARKLEMDTDAVPTPQQVQAERFVVFTFSKKMANLISERFTEDGISHVMYTGDVNADDRDKAVAAFTDPGSDVLAFVATDAAAEGLNLGRCCSTLIQFDPPWTPSRAQQRVNRIHRLDGTAPRYRVINMTLANSLEIGLYRLLGQRADLQDALFGESGARYKATGRRSGAISVFEEAMAEFTASGDTGLWRPGERASQAKPAPTRTRAPQPRVPAQSSPAPAETPVGALF